VARRRDDQVTREIIALAILYATLGSLLLYGLFEWLG